jgi:prevent-host-death family protein
MPVTTLTSREFHQNSAKVKRAAENGPVIITDRGKPTLVVQTYENWESRRHLGDIQKFVSLYDSFSKPHPAEDTEFEIPELREYPREVKFD